MGMETAIKEENRDRTEGGRFFGRALWLLLLLGLVLRIVHGAVTWQENPLTQHLIADALYYDNLSETIAREGIGGESPFYLPPLYPHLLALVRLVFGEPLLAMLFLQGVLGLLSLWLIHRLTRKLFGEQAAFFAVLLALFHAPLIFFETKLVATTLAVFLGLLSVALLNRGIEEKKVWLLAAAGLCIGLLCEARPNFLIFAALALVLVFIQTGRPVRIAWSRPALFVAGLVLPLAASLGLNLAGSGEAILITGNGGINFYFGNHAKATGVNDAPSRDFSSIFDQGPAARRLAEAAEGRPLTQKEVSSYWMQKGLSEIKQDPGGWIGLLVKKARLFLSSFGYGVIYVPEAEAHLSFVQRMLILPAGLLIALGLGGLWIGLRERFAANLPLLLFLTTGVATVLIFFMAERFRVPFMAGFIPFAGLFVARGYTAVREMSFLNPLLCLAATAAFTFLSFYWVDDTIRDNQQTRARISLAKAFLEDEKYGEARLEVVAAMKIKNTETGHYLLGLISEAEGKPEEAEACYLEAAALDPIYLEPRGALADLYESEKDWDRAVEMRREIIEIVPYRFEGYYNLGLTLIDAGRIPQGIAQLEKTVEMASDNAMVWEVLGKAYKLANRNDEAKEAFEKAMALDPSLKAKLKVQLEELKAQEE
jgi:tetratricopeptide (TPR) repeat protein